MTRGEFVERLCMAFCVEHDGVYLRGRKSGWLEQEDELYSSDPIARKNVARILHMYLMTERGVKDLSDISGASCLRDLYDCRACANHVAQMYLRGVMKSRTLDKKGEFLWFDLEGAASATEIEESLRIAKEL